MRSMNTHVLKRWAKQSLASISCDVILLKVELKKWPSARLNSTGPSWWILFCRSARTSWGMTHWGEFGSIFSLLIESLRGRDWAGCRDGDPIRIVLLVLPMNPIFSLLIQLFIKIPGESFICKIQRSLPNLF